MASLLFLTQKTICKGQFIHYIIYQKNTIWKLPKKTKVFGFVGTDHLRTKISMNDETLEQVNHFNYVGCSISYQFSNYVESKMAKFLQIIGTIKRTIFRKVRTETILKIYNTLIVPTFLYGSENWTLTASETKNWSGRNEIIETSGRLHPSWPQKNDFIRRELKLTGILDKIDEHRLNWHLHLQRMPQNRIPLKSYHYRPQGRRTIGRPKKRWRE